MTAGYSTYQHLDHCI